MKVAYFRKAVGLQFIWSEMRRVVTIESGIEKSKQLNVAQTRKSSLMINDEHVARLWMKRQNEAA